MTSPEELPHHRKSDEQLLAECRVDTYRSSGKGGQHVNKTESAVRLTHLPTGIVVSTQDERSQHRNKSLALERLRERLVGLTRRRKKRVATRVPKSVRENILKAKALRARKKQLRKPPTTD